MSAATSGAKALQEERSSIAALEALRHPKASHEDLPAEGPPVNGSNDWVVSGAHTVTGKPLLSNDMHLGHQMPNLWYEAHLRSGALDVAGVTLPGMPYVIVGHNQRIAWGFTNVGPTVTDVFIENFNSQGAYQTPTGWVQPEHRTEVIHVKGKPDVNVDVKITRHGPIITELVPGETRPLALRWTLYDGLHIPFFDVNAAQNWEEFRTSILTTWMPPGRTSCTPTWTETLDITRRERSRFARRETAAFR